MTKLAVWLVPVAMVLLCPVVGSARAADAPCDTMLVRTARVRFARSDAKRKTYRVSLRGKFVPVPAVSAFVPADGLVELRIGSDRIAFGARGLGYGRATRRGPSLRCRDPREAATMRANLNAGRFTASFSGPATFTSLAVEDPAAVEVSLLIGSTKYGAVVGFQEAGRTWNHRVATGTPTPSPPDGAPVSGGATVSYRLLSGSDEGGSWFPRAFAVRSPDAYARIWASRGPITGPPPLPDVDFSKEMVVFVDMGRRPSTASVFDLTSVASAPCGLVVSYHETCGSVGEPIEVFPWVMLAAPSTTGSVTWDRTTTGPCPDVQ